MLSLIFNSKENQHQLIHISSRLGKKQVGSLIISKDFNPSESCLCTAVLNLWCYNFSLTNRVNNNLYICAVVSFHLHKEFMIKFRLLFFNSSFKFLIHQIPVEKVMMSRMLRNWSRKQKNFSEKTFFWRKILNGFNESIIVKLLIAFKC